MKRNVLKIVLALGVAAGGIAMTSAPAHAIQTCMKAYKKDFLKRPGHKAMAITGGRSPFAPNISCGNSWNYPTKRQAIAVALHQCRIVDRKYRDPGKCRIVYAK